MPSRVGVNLRASAYLHQGDRKYMEDEFVVAYQRTADKQDIEYAFFGIFDGHGGKEAAHFAKDHLMDNIVKQRTFWSDDDEEVLQAIREGFIQTHMAMWKVLDKWPRTASGWPSTSGSTASVAFIRKQKIYIGHVGDSGICLGYEGEEGLWTGKQLTKDHKPESNQEKGRINRCGGKVVNKSGVPRVVWNRPKPGHKGPVRRSTPMDEIPFLAVARSLGDLWSYNPTSNQFVVSPVPDVHVHPIDINSHRCLIFGTDGLWNVMSPVAAVSIAYLTEKNNENHYLGVVLPCGKQRLWVNPSRSVVKGALDRYNNWSLRADNTSAVVVFLDPPGRPKREVLLQRKGLAGVRESSILPPINSTLLSNSKKEEEVEDKPYCSPFQSKKVNPPCVVTPDIVRLKDKLANKWQQNLKKSSSILGSKEVASPIAVKTTPQLRSVPRNALSADELAGTPGSANDTPNRTLITPRTSNSSPAVGLANMSHHCSPALSSSLRLSTLRSSVETLSSPSSISVRRVPSISSSISRVMLKRDREDSALPNPKKSCVECSCQRESSSSTPATVCDVCSLSSSLSSKLTDNSNKLATDDDIQIPVISSSTPVNVKSKSTVSPNTKQTINLDRNNPKKRLKTSKHLVTREVGGKVSKLKFKKPRLNERKTRSGLILEGESSNINNNKIWSSDGENKTSLRNKSRQSDQSLETSMSSRVLKSVNRPSTIDPMKLPIALSKFVRGGGKKKAGGVSKHSSSLQSIVLAEQSSSGKKKKPKAMFLRSDKPMITRSQEKTSAKAT